MTTFYLVRHAEIVRKFGDPGLTRKGKKQARAVGIYLSTRNIQNLFSSPLLRAIQTAKIISRTTGVPFSIEGRLRERVNWGDVPGQAWEEFAAEWDRGDLDPDYIPQGGLSANQAAARMESFLEETAVSVPGSDAAVVTHAGIISDFLLAHFQSGELARLQPSWNDQGTELITHASVTAIRWTGSRPVLEGLAAVVG